jgi:mevalonate kinase
MTSRSRPGASRTACVATICKTTASSCYEVSVPEVEATIERLKASGAAGARIVGGGFGGSVLTLFPPGVMPPEDALEVTPGPAAEVLDAGQSAEA